MPKSSESPLLEEDRVRKYTRPELNARIDSETKGRLLELSQKAPAEMSRRIDELDREWDMDRLFERNAAGIALAGVTLAFLFGRRRYLLISATALSFLLRFAIKGWSPPVTVLRRFGIRTRQEIDAEKYALKMMRGDFEKSKGKGNEKPQDNVVATIEAVGQ
jgi:hypothetical protein